MRSRTLVRKLARDTSGAALIEAAFVLPVLLVLVFGAIDFGMYMWQWNAVDKAAHLGARKAIVLDPAATGAGFTDMSTYWVNSPPWGLPCVSQATYCPTVTYTCTGCTTATSSAVLAEVQRTVAT